MKDVEFAKLVAVEYDEAADRVFVKFEICDEKYKDFALRISRRDGLSFNIVGEKLRMNVAENGDS